MENYNIIAETREATVVAEFEPEEKRSDSYQSEAALEAEFIKRLQGQGYEYLQIHSEDELVQNMRRRLEILNDCIFSDGEWQRLFAKQIANANDDILEKTQIIQTDHIRVLQMDDGSNKNIRLIDKKNIHNNFLQVINQYEEEQGERPTRYDVTILVNGLPLVHIELKRRGVPIEEAFNQIERYQRDSFWSGRGLFNYIQLFVISNGTFTKYYSNTTRHSHIKEKQKSTGKKTSNSYKFTSFWTDAGNRRINDLVDFTKTFFAKHTLLNILTKYCVFTVDKDLLVMRPYQIVATERIVNRIEIANNYKKFGTVEGGGYIWHTTGSGKTLTSFKTAQLARELSYIDKVLFVVDRKDLDYQTMKEYDKFEKDAANSNVSTKVLQKQLENPESRIIITTIQKLTTFIKKNKDHPVYDKHVVLIFDECHRSQFGDMHKSIIKSFKKYHIFGFTGTPIFKENATITAGNLKVPTTPQVFGDKLHTYTIVDAINDENVLPFRIDYINTVKMKDGVKDIKVKDINRPAAVLAPERIKAIVTYILDNYDVKTKHNDWYDFRKVKNIKAVASSKIRGKVEEIKEASSLNGFNSLFAVDSIDAAKRYYNEFKEQQKESTGRKLKVALIYSYAPNEEEPAGQMREEDSDSTTGLDQVSRDFLDGAIKDYNEMFSTAYDTSSDKFQNYYKDVSLRMKNREIDILIVVNMFLTGFDATTLNTLWVDKNLRQHGLIQAFSRTNRILNSVKTFGNIVCFRDLQAETNEAIGLFGDKDASNIVLLKSYEDYMDGFVSASGKDVPGYNELLDRLMDYPLDGQILGEKAEIEFIKLFGRILRLRNILSCFEQFKEDDRLSDRQFQDYTGIYNELYRKYKEKRDSEQTNINDDLVFEVELVKSTEVNIDYILMLVEKYHEGHCTNGEIVADIMRGIAASPDLRSKKDLIEGFLALMNTEGNVYDLWEKYVAEELEKDLLVLIEENNLNEKETHDYVARVLRDGEFKTTGTDLDRIMPKVKLFGGNRQEKEKELIERLEKYFDRFFGLGVEICR